MLLQITTTGYVFFISIILGLIITFRISERKKAESGQSVGCGFYGFLTVIYEMFMLFSVFAFISAGSLFGLMMNDTYEGVVVGQSSHFDDDGVQMFTAIVKFTPKGEIAPIQKEMNISSGGQYKIGAAHSVSYNPRTGEAKSASLAAILLLIAGLLMGLFVLSLVIYGFCYAFYIPLPFEIQDIIKVGFVYTFMPLGVIGLDLGILYFVYQYFTGARSDAPIWAVLVSLFFAFVLTFFIISIAYKLIKERKFKALFVVPDSTVK